MTNIYGYGVNGYPSYPSGSGGTVVNAGEGLQSITNADGSITLSASGPYVTFYYDANIPNSKTILAGQNVTFSTSATGITLNAQVTGSGATSAGSYITGVTEASLPNSYVATQGNGITISLAGGAATFGVASTITGATLLTYATGNTIFPNSKVIKAGNNISLTIDATSISINDTFSPTSSGTVTSVGLTVPNFLSVSGSPVTSSGSFTVTANSGPQNSVLITPSAGAGVPYLRLLTYADMPLAAGSNVSLTSNASNGLTIGLVNVGSSNTNGTVTSVGITVPSILSVSGSPVTTAGTFTISLANQPSGAGTFSAPYSGAAGAPSFRQLVGQDISSIFTTGSNISFTPSGTSINVSLSGVGSSNANGTVTSVGLTGSNIFTITGSPVTTSGTFNLSFASQSSGSGFLGAPVSGSPTAPAFRPIQGQDISSIFTAGSNVVITTPGSSINIALTGVGSSNTNGTVTSVGLSAPSFLTVGSSPIATAGTISLTLASQAGSTLLIAPTGAGGTPTFRTLLAPDLPIVAGSNITLTTNATGGLTITSTASGGGGGTVTSYSDNGLSGFFTASVANPTTTPTTTYSFVNQASGAGVLAAPYSGNPAAPSFRVLVGQDIYPIFTAGSNVVITQSGTSINVALTGVGSSNTNGTVTSVAATVPSILSVSGSPITNAGTLAISLVNQPSGAGSFMAPVSGAAASPTFRPIQGQDISSIFTAGSNVVITTPGSSINIALSGVGSSNTNGTVTSYTDNGLSGIFTASVATPNTTPTTTYSFVAQPSATVLASVASGANGTPSFRYLTGNDLTRAIVAGTNVTVTNNGTLLTISALGSSNTNGTVTSVGMTVPSILSVSPSSITTSGTFALSLATQASGGLVLAGPASGVAAAPTFRKLTGNDLSGVIVAGTNTTVTNNGTTFQINGNAGTVTSITMTVPSSLITVSPASITTSGTFAVALTNAPCCTFWAGASSGPAGTPGYRRITGNDLVSTIVAGSNVTITNNGATISISSTASGGGASITGVRTLPASGNISGTYYHSGNWTSTGPLTATTGTTIFVTGTYTLNHTLTVGTKGTIQTSGARSSSQNNVGTKGGDGWNSTIASTLYGGGGGGGFAGAGGNGGNDGNATVNGGSAGSSTLNTFDGLGMGGSAGTASAGGAAGGLFYVRSTGALTVGASGSILAVGASGQSSGVDAGAGGGAGGLVDLQSLISITITATGGISVAGGNGGAAANSNNGAGGGGGGGYVFLSSPSNSVTGTIITSAGSVGSVGVTTGSTAAGAGVLTTTTMTPDFLAKG